MIFEPGAWESAQYSHYNSKALALSLHLPLCMPIFLDNLGNEKGDNSGE
jgi:hypothetical protein